MTHEIDSYFDIAATTMLEIKELSPKIEAVVSLLIETLENGGTVFWCGNGGSASDSQHLAAELVGRFKINRKPLRSVALTTDTSVITATGNDYGFENVFKRQIQALGRPGDLVVGISTSGSSPNVVSAIIEARKMEIRTIAFTGKKKSPLWMEADIFIAIPSEETSHIQEGHIAVGQLICGIVEAHFFA